MSRAINKLIINSPYEEPRQYWEYSLEHSEFILKSGRRSAGYFVAGQGSNQYNDVGQFVPLPTVNDIRNRVKAWRENDYPNITNVTRKLLEHWHDESQRPHKLFFCQLDAIETLIWYTEAPDSEKVGVVLDQENNEFFRICSKMATGTGKTIVMAMLIAWSVLNKVTYPMDKRFSKNVFIVAPGLTVKNRLSVLKPSGNSNYYLQFGIVPPALQDKFNQAHIEIVNWQMLSWESAEDIAKKHIVDKRGPLSDDAYARQILGSMAKSSNILVINDEAHHAWKRNPENKDKIDKDALEEATVWVSGLERINKVCRILTCYDFSATPFAPSGKKNNEEALFKWIISDFGLNDAIESGLVKTPRVVVKDNTLPNAKTLKSRLYHLYAEPEIKEDINRGKVEPSEPLPDLLISAYTLLGADWKSTYEAWMSNNSPVPPVLISVVNRTETAARVKYAFDHRQINIDELCNPEYTIHIDSTVMKQMESELILEATLDGSDEELSKDQRVALIRSKVDTIGQIGKPGEQIRNVISVGMLSEGWDAKTVTHIMGLRAFGSQLLCEQVIGRGLRRTSYDVDEETGLFTPEYVNIFGIPFTYLPAESSESTSGAPPKPTTQIYSIPERENLSINVPNVIRVERIMSNMLDMNLEDIEPLIIDTKDTTISADMTAFVSGKMYMKDLTTIDLKSLDEQCRLQTIVMQIAARTFDADPEWRNKCTKFGVLGQIIQSVNHFIDSTKLQFIPESMNKKDSLERRAATMLNLNTIVQHIRKHINIKNTERLDVLLDDSRKYISTVDTATWFTTKRCEYTHKSQISHCVFDSDFEALDMWRLENNQHIIAYVKNDHFGFEVPYYYAKGYHIYRPDFVIRLDNDHNLIYETKGIKDERAIVKFNALKEWVSAVNSNGTLGKWHCAITSSTADLDGIIEYFIENPNCESFNDEVKSNKSLTPNLVTVRQLIPTIHQPRGGYVPVALFKDVIYDDGKTPYAIEEENVSPSSMGVVTEWLARVHFDDAQNVIVSVQLGAAQLGESEKVMKLLKKIKGTDDESIDAAFKLLKYEIFYRTGKISEESKLPDEKTRENLRIFVERNIKFIESQVKPYRFGKGLFYFSGCISSGEVDFLSKDTIWDFKLSKDELKIDQTLQVMIYYLMLPRSLLSNISSIDKIGLFNARLNKCWVAHISDVSMRAIEEIHQNVMHDPI